MTQMIQGATYRSATREDAAFLAPRLRDADLREIAASTGETPLDALESSFDASDLAFTLVAEGEPVCMGGVCPSYVAPYLGIGWMLGADTVSHNAEALQTFMPEFLESMHRLYPCIGNFVDARNTTSLRWLQHFDFRDVGVVEQYGVSGLSFHWMLRTAFMDH